MHSPVRGALALAASVAFAGCVEAPLAPPPPAPQRVMLSVPVDIMKPGGAGPFPAVVILHDCSGLGPRSSGAPRRWAGELVKEGYVVAIPDSFSTRGHPAGVCVDPSPSRADVAPFRRVPDAYETLDYLRTLDYVDGKHVGVMGGSHGGSSTLAAIATYARDPAPLAKRKREGFAAAVAFYPGCDMGRPRFTTSFEAAAPLLILVGELDDWTPAAPCEKLAQASHRGGAPVAIKVYPGARHSFDSAAPVRYAPERVNASAPGGRGATTGGDPKAWADAIVEVDRFFAAHLKAR